MLFHIRHHPRTSSSQRSQSSPHSTVSSKMRWYRSSQINNHNYKSPSTTMSTMMIFTMVLGMIVATMMTNTNTINNNNSNKNNIVPFVVVIMNVEAFHLTTTTTIRNRHEYIPPLVSQSKTTFVSSSAFQYVTLNTQRIVSSSSSSSSSLSKFILYESKINGSSNDSSISDKNVNKVNNGNDEIVVARRIIVKGDVQGGYYRSCVLNEVRPPFSHGYIYIYIVVFLFVCEWTPRTKSNF